LYPEHIPRELRAGAFWVCWDLRDSTKVPLIPGTDRLASVSDPKTWRSFAVACQALAGHPDRYAGVGRVITEADPYTGLDFDGVRDPATRELSSRALHALRRLDSYSEVSPSGTGVKVWVRADPSRSYRKPGVEVYRARRYFTVTGAFLPQFSAAVEERQGEIAELVAREFPTSSRPRKQRKPYDGPRVELETYLAVVDVFGEVPDGKGLKLAIRCLWEGEHTKGKETGTYIGQFDDGGPYFVCHHAHCAHRTWRDFRRATRINKFRARKLELIKKGLY
jgi:putative DNA primase/helicase